MKTLGRKYLRGSSRAANPAAPTTTTSRRLLGRATDLHHGRRAGNTNHVRGAAVRAGST